MTEALPRFRIETVEGCWRVTYASQFSSRDPDFERDNEHLVIEADTGRVVLRFVEHQEMSGDSTPANPPTGVSSVSLGDGEAHVLATYHDGRTERVALPGFSSFALPADTNSDTRQTE